MKRFPESMLVAVLMTTVLVCPASADWTATLQWSKVVVEGGGLSYSDEGPFCCFYDGEDLDRIEFFDWNGDPTGVTIEASGRSSICWSYENGSYVGVGTLNDSLIPVRYAMYDRAGNMSFEWTERDSLDRGSVIMPCGSGRFWRSRRAPSRQEELTVFESNGSPVCTILTDSLCGPRLSPDGSRLYVIRGCVPGSGLRVIPPNLPFPEIRVYDVNACTEMYTLPRAPSVLARIARNVDVVELWRDGAVEIYAGGVLQGTLGDVRAIGLSPNGQYLAGLLGIGDEFTSIAAYRLDTMTQMWAIPDTADVGGQRLLPRIGDNGVTFYGRDLEGGDFGATLVDPDGNVFFERSFSEIPSFYLGGDGSFCVIEDQVDHVISYYAITEE